MTGQPRRRRIAAPRLRSRSANEVGVRRIRWLLLVYGLVALLAVGQLVRIQIVQADEYADRGIRQRARTIDLTATRGRIYDREGDVVATSVQAATVYGDPRAFREGETTDGLPLPAAADPHAVAEQLAPLIDRDPDDIVERLTRDAHFVYLARQLDHEVGERIAALELPGIGILTEPDRVYPAGGLAGQVVGFTGIDGQGLHGLEAQYESVLAGRPGMLALERAPGGLDIAPGMRELVPPEAGTDLVLSLDREIQHIAEQAASAALDEYDASAAGVLVLEVGTGEVHGMASAPSFDPNDRSASEESTWRNRTVTDVFEPGSTQKALTIAAALEEGVVTPDTTLTVPNGITVSGKRFTDAYPQPEQELTVAEIIERSSNVGTIDIAMELGEERLDEYLRSFGYGSPTGTNFPGEVGGLLMPHEQWWGTSLPTIAIGQGVAVSLLQLAHSYATIANDGVAVTPSLVRGTAGADGRLTPAAPPTETRVVSSGTSRQVRAMLEEAVAGEHGTGGLAAVPGYSVAGKTGTARKPSEDARGYSDEYVATFVGFAPAEAPRFVVAVMVDEPEPYYGGLVAAPIFSEVMEATLAAERVPPDLTGPSLEQVFDDARSDAEELAQREGPATEGSEPASPPAGSPVGGDGTSVQTAADDR